MAIHSKFATFWNILLNSYRIICQSFYNQNKSFTIYYRWKVMIFSAKIVVIGITKFSAKTYFLNIKYWQNFSSFQFFFPFILNLKADWIFAAAASTSGSFRSISRKKYKLKIIIIFFYQSPLPPPPSLDPLCCHLWIFCQDPSVEAPVLQMTSYWTLSSMKRKCNILRKYWTRNFKNHTNLNWQIFNIL